MAHCHRPPPRRRADSHRSPAPFGGARPFRRCADRTGHRPEGRALGQGAGRARRDQRPAPRRCRTSPHVPAAAQPKRAPEMGAGECAPSAPGARRGGRGGSVSGLGHRPKPPHTGRTRPWRTPPRRSVAASPHSPFAHASSPQRRRRAAGVAAPGPARRGNVRGPPKPGRAGQRKPVAPATPFNSPQTPTPRARGPAAPSMGRPPPNARAVPGRCGRVSVAHRPEDRAFGARGG
jgi:hypothetical protein